MRIFSYFLAFLVIVIGVNERLSAAIRKDATLWENGVYAPGYGQIGSQLTRLSANGRKNIDLLSLTTRFAWQLFWAPNLVTNLGIEKTGFSTANLEQGRHHQRLNYLAPMVELHFGRQKTLSTSVTLSRGIGDQELQIGGEDQRTKMRFVGSRMEFNLFYRFLDSCQLSLGAGMLWQDQHRFLHRPDGFNSSVYWMEDGRRQVQAKTISIGIRTSHF